jgi:hypothetical protein
MAEEDLRQLGELTSQIQIQGNRYSEAAQKMVNRLSKTAPDSQVDNIAITNDKWTVSLRGFLTNSLQSNGLPIASNKVPPVLG